MQHLSLSVMSEGCITCSPGGLPWASSNMESACESKPPKRPEVNLPVPEGLEAGTGSLLPYSIGQAVPEPRLQGWAHRSPLSIGGISKGSGATFISCYSLVAGHRLLLFSQVQNILAAPLCTHSYHGRHHTLSINCLLVCLPSELPSAETGCLMEPSWLIGL